MVFRMKGFFLLCPWSPRALIASKAALLLIPVGQPPVIKGPGIRRTHPGYRHRSERAAAIKSPDLEEGRGRTR